jgi:DnaK suppressor protein
MAPKSSKTEKKNLEKQKQTLLKRREDLFNRLAYLSSEGKNTEKKGDSSDLAASSRDEELNLLLGDHERQEIKAIDIALKRIEEGVYGICEECGNRITFKRLEALPFAKHCRDCQAELENRDKQSRQTGTEQLVNLFSDTIKLASLENDDEDEGVPAKVNDLEADMESFGLDGKELEDLEEEEEDSDKD